jgi:phosphoribosylanthranilate isomerase
MIVKVCGVRTAEVARAAVDAGADWIGVVVEERSPRHAGPVEIDAVVAAVDGRADVVGVMVAPSAERIAALVERHRFDAVQLHGVVDRTIVADTAVPVIRGVNPATPEEAFTLDWWPDSLLLLDAPAAALPGGTGQRVDLDVAAEVALRRPIILAGGLGPDSVRAAIAAVHPAGVDASSGLESAPGVKDVRLVVAFVRAAREAIGQRVARG